MKSGRELAHGRAHLTDGTEDQQRGQLHRPSLVVDHPWGREEAPKLQQSPVQQLQICWIMLRPPAIGNVRRDLLPAVAAARDAGIRHVVFLSLQGAERNKVVPHATVESWLRTSALSWTFVRPSFFNQNLSTTHAADIRDRNEILVPAGGGATAFVDVDDVGAVAAAALLDPAPHAGRAWTVTGPRALTYAQVADILTTELGRPITYPRPGIWRYARHAHRVLRMPWPMVAVTTAIYTTARLGLAAGLSDHVRTVLGRQPVDLGTFAHRERAAWLPAPPDRTTAVGGRTDLHPATGASSAPLHPFDQDHPCRSGRLRDARRRAGPLPAHSTLRRLRHTRLTDLDRDPSCAAVTRP